MRCVLLFVGLPGIEPGLYAPEAHVLPVYYSPLSNARLFNYVSSPNSSVPLPMQPLGFLCKGENRKHDYIIRNDL